MASQTHEDLTLKNICNALGAFSTKWFKIGIQLGIPRNKLEELMKKDDPLSAVVDYWLQGNVTESGSPVSWKSIVEALKSEYVGEPALAEQIGKKYCPQKEEITHDLLATKCDSSATDDTSAKTSGQSFSGPDSKLDPKVRMDLEYILEKNIKAILYKYGSYVDCLCDNVKGKGVTPEKLRTYLLSIFATSKTCKGRKLALLSDKKDDLERCSTINAIFDFLTTQCASFLNYEIFQSMLKNFGISENEEKLKYSEYLESYVKKHKISEFTKINPLLKTRKGTTEFLVKFDIETTCKLAKVTELKMILAEILDIHPSALEIVDIDDGCVVVKFLIPTFIAEAIFTDDIVFTPQQREELRAAKVLWLKCNGYTFYFGKTMVNAVLQIATFSALEELEEQLICPTCQLTFSNPKQLQCGHVYCQQCLAFQDQQGQLTCPACHQVMPLPTSGVAGLPAAYSINQLLEIVEERKKVTASTDSAFTHKSITIVCPEHVGRKVTLYCETCGETICCKCTNKGEKHHSHDYKELDEAYRRYKEEITSSLEPLESQLKTNQNTLKVLDAYHDKIFDQRSNIEADIRNTITTLIKTLETRKTELISQLDLLTKAKLKTLAAQKSQIETIQAELNSSVNFIRENLQAGNQGVALTLKEELSTIFHSDKFEPNTEADLKFSAPENFSALCKHYGKVYEVGSPDPSKCFITTERIHSAVVGEKSTIHLQMLNFDIQPCKTLISSIFCELVSETTGTSVRGSVERRGQSQYEISYQPTIKGRHQLLIKVEDQHIRGSPFFVSARSPMKIGEFYKKDDLLLTTTEFHSHKSTAKKDDQLPTWHPGLRKKWLALSDPADFTVSMSKGDLEEEVASDNFTVADPCSSTVDRIPQIEEEFDDPFVQMIPHMPSYSSSLIQSYHRRSFVVKQHDTIMMDAIKMKVSNLLSMKESGFKRSVTLYSLHYTDSDCSFGFKLMGGSAVGLFVSEVNGWSKKLRVGDQLLEIEGQSALQMSYCEALDLVGQAKDKLQLKVTLNRAKYQSVRDQFEFESFYLCSMVDYTSSDVRYMTLRKGSLLRVVNSALYPEAWLAWSVDKGTGVDMELRCIPIPQKAYKQFGKRAYEPVEGPRPPLASVPCSWT